MPVDVNRPGPWNHRNLTARGTRFHVALAGPEAPSGSGLLTLLIHGFPECWWTWRHVIPALAQAGHRVAALDLRGFGGSDRPPSGYDLVTLAQDLAAVVRSLGHERAVVIGAGLGGQVAWALPHVAPDLTRAIVPVGAPHPLACARCGPGHCQGRRCSTRACRSRAWPSGDCAAAAPWRACCAPGPDRIPGRRWQRRPPYYAELLSRPGAARSALEPLRNLMLSRAETAALERPVTVPVLSVQGQLDPVQPAQAYARDTHHVTDNLRQATIRRSGHFPQEEAPAELVRALMPFLADVAPAV